MVVLGLELPFVKAIFLVIRPHHPFHQLLRVEMLVLRVILALEDNLLIQTPRLMEVVVYKKAHRVQVDRPRQV